MSSTRTFRLSPGVVSSILLVTALAFLAISPGCKKNPVVPPDNSTGMKDPRTYTWTVDTLAYPGSYQTGMMSIWGTGPNDLYVVGHNDQNRGLMYHRDKGGWSPVKLTASEGGSITGAIDLVSIFGFDSTHVLAVGEQLNLNPSPPPNFLDTSMVLQYNGSIWTKTLLNGRFLLSIWGSDPMNIWVGGLNGSLLYQKDQSWIQEYLPVTPPANYTEWEIQSISGFTENDVYVLASAYESSAARDTYYFLHRSMGVWALIDSFVNQPGLNQNKWGDGSLWASPWGTLYSVGTGVFQWNGSSWMKILTTVGGGERIFGDSPDDIFVSSSQSELFHYNGKDWYQYENLYFPGVTFLGGWTDGKEVFVIGWLINSGPLATIILHGR